MIAKFKTESIIKFSDIVILLMLVQPLLGATVLKEIQVATEVITIIFLSLILIQHKFKYDLILLCVIFTIVSFLSLFTNEFYIFSLNFKLYLLPILVLLYFSKFKHIPEYLFYSVFLILILYPLFVRVFNIWPIESMSIINENGKSFLYSRPIGFFGSPHASAQFAAIYFLFFFHRKKYLLSIFAFVAILLYNSSTAIFALFGQLFYNAVCRISKKDINPFVFLVIIITILFLSLNILDSVDISDSDKLRLSSAKVILPMIFDLNYYKGVFNLLPKSSDSLVVSQKDSFSEIGNEIGLIKLIVEGGVFLSFIFLFVLFKRVRKMSIFIFLTLLHYSFIMILPIFLFFTLKIDEELGV